MKLLLPSHIKTMLLNGQKNAAGRTTDFKPVVKLFCPWTAATWLLTELDPDEPDIAFGLCDLGFGTPELGYVSISELERIEHPHLRLGIERDIHFVADKFLSQYTEEARKRGRIVA